MVEKTVATPAEQQAPAPQEVTRAEDRYIAPPVDIFEDKEGLVVVADLPGATHESLEVRVEKGVLTIEARTSHVAPGTPIHREYQLVNFFRQFQLPERVSVEETQRRPEERRPDAAPALGSRDPTPEDPGEVQLKPSRNGEEVTDEARRHPDGLLDLREDVEGPDAPWGVAWSSRQTVTGASLFRPNPTCPLWERVAESAPEHRRGGSHAIDSAGVVAKEN